MLVTFLYLGLPSLYNKKYLRLYCELRPIRLLLLERYKNIKNVIWKMKILKNTFLKKMQKGRGILMAVVNNRGCICIVGVIKNDFLIYSI